MPQSNYVVAVGQTDKERLAIQHQTFAAGSEKFLNSLPVISGTNVLIVGCGAGDELFIIGKMEQKYR